LIEYNSLELSYLLSPKSVALIGASNNSKTIGGTVLINLQKSLYKGNIYPIHSEHKEVFGIQTYPDLMSIPEKVDTVVIMKAIKSVQSLLYECEEKKVKIIILLTSFAEVSEDQRILEKELKLFSDKTGIRILGPDSFGLFNLAEPFSISSSLYYEPNRIKKGKISVITADAGLGRTILDAADRGIGFNYWISTGLEVDLDVADFIKYMAHDPSTQVIFALVDGIKDKQKFLHAAKASKRAGKPLIVLNIGRTETGLEENQSDFILVDDVDELMNVGWLIVKHGIPTGDRIGIFSYSTGIKTLLANKCLTANLTIPDLTNKTKGLLLQLAPEFGVALNPNQLPNSIFQDLGVFRECLEIFSNDGNLDVVLVPFPYKLGTYTEVMLRHTLDVAKRMNKPIIPLWISLSGEMEVSYEILMDSQLPFYRTVDTCVLAVKQFIDYYMNRSVFATLQISGDVGNDVVILE
jgi:acetate---CoA ligase (ADP-forming)